MRNRTRAASFAVLTALTWTFAVADAPAASTLGGGVLLPSPGTLGPAPIAGPTTGPLITSGPTVSGPIATGPTVETGGPIPTGPTVDPDPPIATGPTLEPGGPPLEATVKPPRFQVRFPFSAPALSVCARALGTPFVRKTCAKTEIGLDPTALALCRRSKGTLTLRALGCTAAEKAVDLRAVRGMAPSVWLTASAAAVFEEVVQPKIDAPPSGTPIVVDEPIAQPPTIGTNPIDVPPIVDAPPTGPVFRVRDELCATKTNTVTLRRTCAKGETPLDPSALVTCIEANGALVVRAIACPKTDEWVDLRELAASSPVGVGPLVGVLPRLVDLASEYPNG